VTFAFELVFKSVAIELAEPVFSSMILSFEDSDRAKVAIDALSARIEHNTTQHRALTQDIIEIKPNKI
jgi:hypothetical protein